MAELLERHHVENAPQIEQMFVDRGDPNPVSYVTINRILNAEARTRPNPDTLQRVAELLGETLAQAFPEPDDERAPVVVVNGRRIALKALDGPPLTQREAAALIAEAHQLDGRAPTGNGDKSESQPRKPPRPTAPRPRGSR